MKPLRKLRKSAVSVLAASMLFSAIMPTFASADELATDIGKMLDERKLELAPGAAYTWNDMELASGLQKVHTVTFNPASATNLELQPAMSGGKVYGMQTISGMADAVDEAGNRVIAAVNGDFYDMATGVPLGFFMGEGDILMSPPAPASWLAFGLKEDGTSVYGFSPVLTRTLAIGGKEVPITHINHQRSDNALMLYTSDYYTSTKTNELGDEVIVDIISGGVRSGETMGMKVVEIRKDQGDSALQEGQAVLSASGGMRTELAGLSVGDELSASFELEQNWQGVKLAIGGSAQLVKDGVAQTFADKAIHPRTAVGTKEDGTIVMMQVDGRSPGFSEGVSLDELAIMMKNAGVHNALNLDGGGSATFIARLPGDSGRTLLNRPSDGSERKTANGLLLVNKAPEGAATGLAIQPAFERVLVNGSITYTAKGIDANGHPAAVSGTPQWSAAGAAGTMTADGAFTAGSEPGFVDVTVTQDGLTGMARLEVVDEVTELVMPDAIRTFNPGETVQLSVTALRDGQVLQAGSGSFQWHVEGDIGSIDESGMFTASDETDKSGRIYARYGAVETSMEVTVGIPPLMLEDFESGLDRYREESGDRYVMSRISLETDEEYVRSGSGALKLEYDFTGTVGTSGAYLSTESADLNLEIPGYPEKISMWVYGDGQGHWLRGQLRDGNGKAVAIDFDLKVDYVGWKYLEAEVPKGRPTPFTMDRPVRYMETSNTNKTAGVLYVDDIRALYGDAPEDWTPPVIKDAAPADGSVVTTNTPKIQAYGQSASYDPDGNAGTTGIDPEKIRMYVDDELVQHTLYPPKGQIHYTPDMPLADGVHKAKLKIRDLIGNRAEQEWYFQVDTGSAKIAYEPPAEVYAGNVHTLDIAATGASKITNGHIEMVMDTANTTDIEVVKGSRMSDENVVAHVDAETGVVHIAFDKVHEAGLQDGEALAHIRYRVKPDAGETMKASFKSGAMRFLDTGNTSFSFYGMPIEAAVKHHLTLEWDEFGVVEGYPTTLQVRDESGEPVEGVAVLMLEDAGNGSTGTEIGVTDAAGMLRTDELTASVKDYKLQAVKGDWHSRIQAFKVSPLAGTPEPYNVSVTMWENTETTRGFNWHTDPHTEGTVVEVAPQASFTDFSEDNVLRFTGESELFNTFDTGTVRVHKAAASGLTAGTAYVYRVGDGNGNYSATGTFVTAAADGSPIQFLFVGDSQASNEPGFKLWGDILGKAMTDNPGTEFIVHGGDLVEDGFRENEWNMWFGAAEEELMSTTVVPVVGNHEVTGTRHNEDFLAHFNHPQNGIDSLKGTNFSFDYGNAHFVVLNSEYDFEEQRDWLREDLAATDKLWKFVAFHRGPFGSMYDSEHIRNVWTPIFDEFGVDVVMNGHDHVYLRTYPMKAMQPVNDGEGTVYIVGGSTGPKFYDVVERYWQHVTFDEDTQIYVAAEIDGMETKFVVKTIDDRIVDQFSLVKLPPQAVLVTPAEQELAIGESVMLNATVAPAGAYDKSVTWSVYQSSEAGVVSLGEDGLVTGLKAGTATVRATSVVESVYADSVITVVDLPGDIIDEVKVNPSSLELLTGEQFRPEAIVLPETAGNRSVIWSVYSSEPGDVVKVESDGTIKALRAGTAAVRATSAVDGTKYADLSVTVTDPAPVVEEVRLDRNQASVVAGGSLQLKATVLPEKATDKEVVWTVHSSSRDGVASVSDTGLVHGLRSGTATIRAASKSNLDIYDELILTVYSAPVYPGVGDDEEEEGQGEDDASTPEQGELNLKPKMNEGSTTAAADVTERQYEQALQQVEADDSGLKTVTIKLEKVEGAESYQVGLPRNMVAGSLSDVQIRVVTPYATLLLPAGVLAGDLAADEQMVRLHIGMVDKNTLSDEVRDAIGNRPVVDLEWRIGEEVIRWSNSDAPVKVMLPYEPTRQELMNPDSIVIWYVNEDGEAESVPNGRYDAVSGTVQFETAHFSRYAVAYVSKIFRDLGNYEWAKWEIEALAARDVLRGTGDEQFSPARHVTRAEFVTMLVRMLGISADAEAGWKAGFSDVREGAFYYEAVSIAESLGIVQGKSDGKFAPDASITRQELFVMTTRALRAVNKLDDSAGTADLDGFLDAEEVAEYAQRSISALAEAGIVEGSEGRLRPLDYANRAQAAALMYRILFEMK
ncbi:phosphodiester glycosidase family protein [Paenibacillus sp. J5C_2022]|uniref:phosphodiester glycosidase family protein n=1 Tax=Paenibacillus sp. J5C2022 TaxID=2977129 RepID=UPI0021D3E4B8|nr:phosphodiester glycosidase family protein [Paenibacillus sp. J5C2022]MCU6713095.1 phosphodiester glycosidase family protein [Paenibacillus sp. J5C2022]